MDWLVQNGVNWIIAVQSLGAWLEGPMQFFSFLGTEDFFFLVLPLLYWSVDAPLGMRVAYILMTSASINQYFKLLFASPRPYWVSEKVIPLSAESSFGVPSGHAQNAVSVWGILAVGLRKPWAWGVALVLMFFIGFSRWYLGVHFVHDVVVGWILGALILWALVRFEEPVVAWFKAQTFGMQALFAFIISLVLIGLGMLSAAPLADYAFPEAWQANALRAGELPDPVSMEGFITLGGTFFGLTLGLAWIMSRGGYQVEGTVAKRALRYVIGLIGVVLLMFGLDMVFPDGHTLIPFTFRFVRYALVGFWISAGAPWLFFRFNLANSKM